MGSSDNALGCMWAVVIGVAAILFASFAFGAPVLTGDGLSWDNSGWINRETQRTERERIQANRDIRIEQERGKTVQAFVAVAGQTLVIVAVAVGVAKALPPIVASIATAIASAFAAWAARPHRPAAVQRIEVHMSFEQARLLAQPHLRALPGSRLEWIDGEEIDGAWVQGWSVVDDARAIVRPLQLTDSQHRA